MMSAASSLSKTNIKEANDHLQKLHQRIFELETQLQLHSLHVEDLQQTNAELQRQLVANRESTGSLLKEKEREIGELKSQLEAKDLQVQRLLSAAEERDDVMLKLEEKSRVFYEVAEHRSSLAQILRVLEDISQSK
ncbi:PREDICTED: uncharacterized protein LOC109588416 [Amphimedon queenslandica]|uniref:Uncharacterized protein n=1 Tax=Amphimedon queenslandica TaxID=400682 RepID=A0A1X7TDJ8_AMPQE|nr:PREDICTED: uncharacterized protein LOC109588416 [Amphimedon queenslandica]|eukprot:XP_019860145.1 PREDICTED: uncharacterized protein LOC109588416 [Amphimedon queenslandica]